MNDTRIIFKNNIVKYLRQEIPDEGIDVLDVFKYDGNQSLQLTHFGYRNLKEYYTFLDVEFQFNDILVVTDIKFSSNLL